MDSRFGGNDRSIKTGMDLIANRNNAKQKVIVRRVNGEKVSTSKFYSKPKRDYKI